MKDISESYFPESSKDLKHKSLRVKSRRWQFRVVLGGFVLVLFSLVQRVQYRCEVSLAEKYGLCLKSSEVGKYFFDPCLPQGQELVKEFLPFGVQQIANRRSPLSKSVERHRFLCLTLPTMLRSHFPPISRPAQTEEGLSYGKLQSVTSLRVLAFAPQNEESIAWTFERHLQHRPIDYIRADISPRIAQDYDGVVINAESIPFPAVSSFCN